MISFSSVINQSCNSSGLREPRPVRIFIFFSIKQLLIPIPVVSSLQLRPNHWLRADSQVPRCSCYFTPDNVRAWSVSLNKMKFGKAVTPDSPHRRLLRGKTQLRENVMSSYKNNAVSWGFKHFKLTLYHCIYSQIMLNKQDVLGVWSFLLLWYQSWKWNHHCMPYSCLK